MWKAGTPTLTCIVIASAIYLEGNFRDRGIPCEPSLENFCQHARTCSQRALIALSISCLPFAGTFAPLSKSILRAYCACVGVEVEQVEVLALEVRKLNVGPDAQGLYICCACRNFNPRVEPHTRATLDRIVKHYATVLSATVYNDATRSLRARGHPRRRAAPPRRRWCQPAPRRARAPMRGPGR